MTRRRVDVIGLRYGRLTVLRETTAVDGRRRVLCLCDCGTETVSEPRYLRCGKKLSCGCKQRDAVSATALSMATHNRHNTREYNIWTKMKSRCFNQNDAKYPLYGGRGITVCSAWKSNFSQFLRDMGQSPTPQHSIDRRNNDGNYEASNCRWATPLEQSRNKRSHRIVEFRGVPMPLSQACAESGVNYRSALYRLNRGQIWLPLPPPPVKP